MNTLINVRFTRQPESSRKWDKVLIVEDEPLWQIVIERALRLIDPEIEVRVSGDANQAFELLNKEGNFDLVIADQLLNGAKTGLDLWDILLEQKVDIPFVIVSGTKREIFLKNLMPYRNEMVPRYIEKNGSVKHLSDEFAAALFSHSPIRTDRSEPVIKAAKDNLGQIMKKKYYWMVGLAIVLSGIYYSFPVLNAIPKMHMQYANYLNGLERGDIPAYISKVFSKPIIQRLNDLAMNKDILNLADKPSKLKL